MQLQLSPDERFLVARFRAAQRTLSWALVGAGFGEHSAVLWHFVRREELGLDVDAEQLLRTRMHERGLHDAVGLLTARHLAPYASVHAESGAVRAQAVATVGLGNALRAGDPVQPAPRVGTINLLCHVSQRLSDAAMLEALALCAEARTAALLESGVRSVVSGEAATGTGTDCIVLACPTSGVATPYAGKHTDVGAAIGESVLLATQRATRGWLQEHAAARSSHVEVKAG